MPVAVDESLDIPAGKRAANDGDETPPARGPLALDGSNERRMLRGATTGPVGHRRLPVRNALEPVNEPPYA